MSRFLSLLKFWESIPVETRSAVLRQWPWLLAALIGGAIACYLFCPVTAEGSPPAGLRAQLAAAEAEVADYVARGFRRDYVSRAVAEDRVAELRRQIAATAKTVRPKVEPKSLEQRGRCSPACSCGCNSGQPCTCSGPAPATKPAAFAAIAGDWRVNGVEHGNLVVMPKGMSKVSLHTHGAEMEVSPEQAKMLVQNGQLPDDAKRVRLTVIGPDTARKQVMTDLESSPALASVKDRVVVQAYAPGNPLLAGLGFVEGGNPTIYLQAPGGGVLHRQDDYRGPEFLAAAIVEALRVADPEYKPAADPNLNNRSIGGVADWLGKVPAVAWALAGVGGVLLLLNLNRNQNGGITR